MPRVSIRKEILQVLDDTAITVARMRNEEISASLDSSDLELTDCWTDTSSNSSLSDSFSLSPMSLSSMSLDSESTDTISTTEMIDKQYNQLLSELRALRDEVVTTRVLERLTEPMPKASQLHILEHCAEHHPDQFCQKLRVDPHIFDDILDQISEHPVFQNQSNNRQLPVAIQLAVFLFRAGHYGNACTPEDVAQWAGVSAGMVINCTHRVMAAVLDQHDQFIYIPDVQSEDMREARMFAESRACRAWRNGVFAADGSAINLYARPGMFADAFYDRKSRFSLNCQVCVDDLISVSKLTLQPKTTIMPHNLMIVDYALGQPGSVHDAYAFQGTRMSQDPTLIPPRHWIWADSAYPSETWCAVPFKKPHGGNLSRRQHLYNRYLSIVRTIFSTCTRPQQ